MTDLAAVRRVLEAAVAELPASQLPELAGLLETAKARALVRAFSPTPQTTDVVDVATLATELDVAESWLRTQARTGKLPHIRAGKYIKFRRSEVLAALEHRMAGPVRAENLSNGVGSFPPGFQKAGALNAD